MKRRDFLKHTSLAGTIPLFVGGLPVQSLGATLRSTATCEFDDRILVLVLLDGGNDFYNTFVGLSEYDNYVNQRPRVHLPLNRLITLDSTLPNDQQLGLHPRLTYFKEWYDQGKLSLVQRLGYDNPNRSHFESLQIMLEGIDGTGYGQVAKGTGWIGRFFDNRYPDYAGIPFEGEPDPLGLIMHGGLTNIGFLSASAYDIHLRISGNAGNYYNSISGLFGEPLSQIPNSQHGAKLRFMENIDSAASLYGARISETYNNGTNTVGRGSLGSTNDIIYPYNQLGDQLNTVARMISGGCQTQVYLTSSGAWDTHGSQVEGGDSTRGSHDRLLDDLSMSLKAFQDDLENQGLADKVLTVVWSEFARKAIDNDAAGTDHGTLSGIWCIGNGVQPGVTGKNVDFTDIDNQGAINEFQKEYDFKQVFGSILQDWMGTSDESLSAIFPDTEMNTDLSLINSNAIVSPECYFVPGVQEIGWNVGAKVFLQGYYDEAMGEMRMDLTQGDLVPSTQPFTDAPFNYTGAESVSAFPTDTVDWLLVELRDASNLSTIIATKAVLLRKDGMLMETDGTMGVTFVNIPSGFYHLAIFSRNHLAVMSAGSIGTSEVNPMVDFTTDGANAMGTEQLTEVNGVWTLFVGDYDSNGLLNNQDFNAWKRNPAALDAYLPSDGDGNGIINNQDFNLWRGNGSKIGLEDLRK
ncbi:MAG: DUF1501 domain-containing protein [Bacteroidota bacterium]